MMIGNSNNHESKGRAADNDAKDICSNQLYTTSQVQNKKRRKPEFSDNHEDYGMADYSNPDDLSSEQPYTAYQVKNQKRRTKLEYLLRHVHDLQSITSYHEGIVEEPSHSYIFMCEDDIVDEPRKGRDNQRKDGIKYTFLAPETYSSPLKLGTMLVSIGTKMCEDAELNLERGRNWTTAHDVYDFFSSIHSTNKTFPARTGKKQVRYNRCKRYGKGYK